MNERPVIVGIGEALWDMLPSGAQFGGAPANFSCHAAMLRGDAYLVSQVGEDELGEGAIAALRASGVHTEYVGRIATCPTGTVPVTLDDRGQASYEIQSNVAWDYLAWSDGLEALAAKADAVCFGTLGQRSLAARQTIRRFLEVTRPDCLRVFDVNLRQRFYDAELILESLGIANVLKLNEEELVVVAPMCGIAETGLEALARLRAQFDLSLIALTRGADGAVLLTESETREFAAVPVTVKDTVGAGDSFTAATVLGWLRGFDLVTIGTNACRIAAFVSSQSGATPTLPSDLKF